MTSMRNFEYELTLHAKKKIEERNIKIEWIEKVLYTPQLVNPDNLDPTLSLAYAPIAEYENRALCVVCDYEARPVRVITVHFERRLKGKL
jgi:uncharacterized DUF497 family protein